MSDLLHEDLPRGGAESKEGQSPSARFAPTGSIANSSLLRFEPGKHFLGVVNGTIQTDVAPDGRQDRFVQGGVPIGIDSDQHQCLVAGSRSGKGRAALIPNLLTYPGSVLAIDPKGELAEATAAHRAVNFNQSVYVLDPFGVVKGKAEGYRHFFNPLQELTPEKNFVADAGLVADGLVVSDEARRDEHWNETARHLIEGLVMHVATAEAFAGERTLGTVYDLLNGRIGVQLRKDMAANNATAEIKHAATTFFDKADAERESVLSTARRHMRFMGYQEMRDVTQSHAFSLKDLRRSHITIYLCLPAMRLGTCSRWLRLMINQSLAALEQVALSSREGAFVRPKYPVLFCLDEFAILGHLKTIEDAAGQLAGLGARLLVVLQDLTQLKALYKERWETFLGNSGIVQCFGNSDVTTLEWISKRLGETTIETVGKGDVAFREQFGEGRTGVSRSSHVHPLMTGEEVSRFFGRDDKYLRQLIIAAGRPALILQRAYWDRHELFRPGTIQATNDNRASAGVAQKAA